jgi:hypothetical protein
MSTSYKRLIDHWTAQGLKIAAGATEREVVSFESQNRVSLPEDFREYFLKVNGMVQDFENSCDQTGFAFWPLSLVTSVAKECAKRSPTEPTFRDPESYFVFADYLQWSWAFAIHIDANSPDDGQVVHVGTLRPKVVAGSFTEFVNLYLQDARELYTDAA